MIAKSNESFSDLLSFHVFARISHAKTDRYSSYKSKCSFVGLYIWDFCGKLKFITDGRASVVSTKDDNSKTSTTWTKYWIKQNYNKSKENNNSNNSSKTTMNNDKTKQNNNKTANMNIKQNNPSKTNSVHARMAWSASKPGPNADLEVNAER